MERMAEHGAALPKERAYRLFVLAVGVGLYSFLAYRSAWLCDDAFISLRTASNFLHGYGLRWNVDERVQTFTHPLWLFVLIGAHAVTREPFYSTLLVSWSISAGAVALLLFGTPGKLSTKLIGLTVLIVSKAFIDFSSSGLENPLTHALIIGFVAVWVRCPPCAKRAAALSGIAGLAALNRLDTALIFAPALVLDACRWRRLEPRLVWYAPAAIPVVLWEMFSVIYYGFPFPNTAYAKLAQVSVETPLINGLNYLYTSLQTDPITLIAIGACFSASFMVRDRDRLCLTGGAVLYLAYAVRVGGDFMSGRFLSAPLCMCVACLMTSAWLNVRRAALASVAIACCALLGHWSPLPAPEEYVAKPIEAYINRFGIHDERRLFFAVDSLSNASHMNPLMPNHPWSRAGFRLRGATNRVHVIEAIGHAGYFAGPTAHLIDHWALSDALLARLPAVHGKYGHYPRVIPDGYVETLATHREHIVDPSLARYHSELESVIRGPVWAWPRFEAIWRLNAGSDGALLDRYAYVRGPQVSIQLQFANPSAHSCVVVYVWNHSRTSGYELDRASTRNRTYRVAWRVTARAATLLSPAGLPRTAAFSGLEPSGWFAVSVAFSDRPDGPLREVHELRYSYRVEHDQLVVQKQPWPTWNENFPAGPWHDGRAPRARLHEAIE
jgi:arabinofuranosyltransferase